MIDGGYWSCSSLRCFSLVGVFGVSIGGQYMWAHAC